MTTPHALRVPAGTTVLRVLACATVALAPVEGYLASVHAQLAKLPPALLIAAWAVVRLRRREMPRPHAVHVVLAAFTVLVLASAAAHADGPFTVEYTIRWLPFVAVAVVLIDVAATDVPIRALLIAAVAGATVAGAGALHSLVVAGAARATGPLADPNDLAFVVVTAVPLLAAVLPAEPAPRHVLAVTVAAAVLVAGAAATFSRGGALALTAAVGWLVLRRALSPKVLAGAAAAVVVAAGATALLAGPHLARSLREKSFIAGANVDTRELRWQASARMLAEHPLLGVGPGGFRAEYAAASHNAEIAEQTPVAHNMFLEVAAELGLPAFCLFLALTAIAMVSSEHVLRSTVDRRPMVAVQASVVAVAIGAVFLSEQYYLPLWLLIAVSVAAALRTRREGRSAGAGAPRDQ
ncbi:O-antigen ligase family protein [Actinophytocola algeriensis]|uniref:O-antigen ligase n=1 Tax=Actinophytocola algeriensis TaxID=1768010 RepID=A0A7W7Q3C3_9PSEU|nr:O-antigen ligase family protein [Actinophytocola algeriensis]MBB4905944.1 O-antigen ligase [Actinophytocola algeriensis]MBE1472371.1 O-antigen ligase [Actinophytocola algeriensis]